MVDNRYTFSKVFDIDTKGSLKNQNVTVKSRYLEKHWHPIGLEFLERCLEVRASPSVTLLYVYMLIRSSPDNRKRTKSAHLYGDTIQKGEFFENKIAVAKFFGKGHLNDKAKIDWFSRTVKPLVELGLVKKIGAGKRGQNATYIVYDIREIPPL